MGGMFGRVVGAFNAGNQTASAPMATPGASASGVLGGSADGPDTPLGKVIRQARADALPVAPTIDNSQAEIQAATDAQLRRSTQGRASTILTGGQGVTQDAPTSSAKLLGLP